MIEKYSFGSIIINGKEYNFDVEVRWTGEVLKWWRKEGHKVYFEDVKRAIDQNPETIIIGTGASGFCKITEECKREIEKKGIKLIIEETEKAIKSFNGLLGKEKVIGLFHLTC